MLLGWVAPLLVKSCINKSIMVQPLFTELEPDTERIKGIQYINKALDKVRTKILLLNEDIFLPELIF